MIKRLTHADALIIQYLLEDPTIKGILVDENKKEVYSRIDINEDGSITLGKTSFKWWNHFIGDEKIVSFNEFAIKAANAISGQKNNTNEKVFAGLLEVIGNRGIKNEDYSYVIDQLLIATKFGMDGPLKCRCVNLDSGDPTENRRSVRQQIEDGDVKIHVRGKSDQIPLKFKVNNFGDDITINARMVIEEPGFSEVND